MITRRAEDVYVAAAFTAGAFCGAASVEGSPQIAKPVEQRRFILLVLTQEGSAAEGHPAGDLDFPPNR
jgi:hypothetical protein